jgi:hypothetical protein
MLSIRSLAASVLLLLWVAFAMMVLPGCAGEKDAAFSHAIRQATPPRDFALSLTVQGPSAGVGTRSIITPGRDGRPGYAVSYPVLNTSGSGVDTRTLPLTLRPARYVLEPDWVLRTGVGAGSRETYHPFQTRQLNAAQVDRLWNALVKSGLLAPDHEAIVSRTPTDEESGDKTLYIVSYTVAGVRRTLVLAANEKGAGESASAEAGSGASGVMNGAGESASAEAGSGASGVMNGASERASAEAGSGASGVMNGASERASAEAAKAQASSEGASGGGAVGAEGAGGAGGASPVEGVLAVFAELSWLKDAPPATQNRSENEAAK